MNFVDYVFDCYSHITSHVSLVFASCTHYTSYSLLNIVHVIVCVYGLTNQIIANTLNFVQTKFVAWKFVENAKKKFFGNFGLKILDLKNKLIWLKALKFKTKNVWVWYDMIFQTRILSPIFPKTKFCILHKFSSNKYSFHIFQGDCKNLVGQTINTHNNMYNV